MGKFFAAFGLGGIFAYIAVAVSFYGFLVYAAYHFITKFW